MRFFAPSHSWFVAVVAALALAQAPMTIPSARAAEAIRDTRDLRPAYPPSPIIASITWAPVAEIVRDARDGDNWPVTWAADDALYSTWGDGTGFAPKTKEKLSCGFARIEGMPPQFRGTNVRTPAEQLGQGRDGLKGWGALAVDGSLYVAFGHANKKGGETQLAVSTDLARTWRFVDWKFSEFGLLGFINFGRDYAGARDGYVYAYSHNGPLADTPADDFVLLRVPKARVAERAAWEIFTGKDAAGQPGWSGDFTQRASVFHHADGCLRSAITYHPGLRRYLWWQAIPQPRGHRDRGDTRFEGGFAVYDAPEPWGPWTTAFFTPKWDVGPGEHGDFPQKWMSADGKTAWLVFSGEDAFSARQATFVLQASAAK